MASDKHDKKRKRDSDRHERHERPSKKPALDLQRLPPLTAKVVDDHSELAPVIVTTPGINAPKDLHLNPYFKNRDNVSSVPSKTRNRGISSSEILLQSSAHPKMDFLGREAEDDADSQLKHYIAVVDPEKKTWEFVEARKVTLRSGVRNAQPGDEEEEEEEEEEEDAAAQTMRAQKTALTNTFGTKASRKAAQSMAENAQLSNAPAGEANAAESAILSSMPADPTNDMGSKSAAVEAEVQAAKPLPQANLGATHPSDVYPIDVLVPNGHATLRQLPGVSEWQAAVTTGQAVTTGSLYVSRRVEAVAKSGNTTHLQLLRYILILLEFARCLRPDKHAKSAGPGSKRLPPRDDLRRILSSTTGLRSDAVSAEAQLKDPIVDSLRRKFAPQGASLSKNEVTLLHTTICALSLHIPPQPGKDGSGGNPPNELATDPFHLRDDLRLDTPTIAQYFRELGCRVDKPRESEFAKWNIKGGKAEAAARRVARLKVPLEFPKMSRGGRR